jgi:hypothetical protein
MTVTHKSVFSSHIDRVSYDDASGRLTVVYQNGKTSAHNGVPAEVAHRVMTAESVGKALHTHVRGKFDHSYLDAPK